MTLQDVDEPRSGANGLTGNRARDHLANERTYMAWLRTSLGLAATGALFTKVSDAATAQRLVAMLVCTGISVILLAYGTRRYYSVMHDLDEGRFHPSGRGPAMITIGISAVLIVVLPLLVL